MTICSPLDIDPTLYSRMQRCIVRID